MDVELLVVAYEWKGAGLVSPDVGQCIEGLVISFFFHAELDSIHSPGNLASKPNSRTQDPNMARLERQVAERSLGLVRHSGYMCIVLLIKTWGNGRGSLQ